MASTFKRCALNFHLSVGNRHDAPECRKFIASIFSEDGNYLIMGIAYEYEATKKVAIAQVFIPVVQPKKNRKKH